MPSENRLAGILSSARHLFWPILPALFFFALLRFALLQSFEADRDKAAERWEQRAIGLLEDFRQCHAFESQVNQMAYDMKTGLEKRLPQKPSPGLTGEDLVAAMNRSFPKSHRPAETLLYGFSLPGSGGFQQLSGKGLASNMGRIIGVVLAAMARIDALDPKTQMELDRRTKSLFGNLMSFNLLGVARRGKLTQGDFAGRKVDLVWDIVTVEGKILGCFLIIFPEKARQASKPLAFAMRKYLNGDIMPMLVPIDTASFSIRPIVPPDLMAPSLARKLLRSIRSFTNRDRDFPAAERSAAIPGFWILRDLISSNLPYELWLVSNQPSRWKAPPISRVEVWGLLLFTLWWSVFHAYPWLTGQRRFVSLQTWFSGYFVLVGAVPLIFLFFLGAFLLETAIQRQIQDNFEKAMKRFEEIDIGSARVSSRFDEECRRFSGDRQFLDELRNYQPGQLTPALKRCFLAFRKVHVPLDLIIL